MTAYAAIGGLFLLLLFVMWLAFRMAEQKGRSEAESDRVQKTFDQARMANEIDEGVKRLSDSDLDRELRDGG